MYHIDKDESSCLPILPNEGHHKANAMIHRTDLHKIVPPTVVRKATSATWVLTDGSSHSARGCLDTSSILHWESFGNPCINSGFNNNDRHDFDDLARLSKRYRDRCLLLDKKHRQGMLELQYLCSQNKELLHLLGDQDAIQPLWRGNGKLGRFPSSSTSKPSVTHTTKHEPDVTPSSVLDLHAPMAPGTPASLPPPHEVNEESFTDTLVDFYLSKDEMRQQKQILDAIQWSQRPRGITSQQVRNQDHVTPLSASDISSNLDFAGPSLPSRRMMEATAVKTSPSVKRNEHEMYQDRLTSFGNGKKLRVKGTKHTMRSIQKGQATIVQCPGCHTIMQLSSTTKNLFCTICGQVSPVSIVNVVLEGQDNQIASVLQRQEIHVKLAKN